MSSDEDEHPPKQLLRPLTQPDSSHLTLSSHRMTSNTVVPTKKPYQITFSSQEEENNYTRNLLDNRSTFNGDPYIFPT